MKQSRQDIKDIDTYVAGKSLTDEQKIAYNTTRAELIELAVTNVNNVNRATMKSKSDALKTTLGM
jgi:hypothetical protein